MPPIPIVLTRHAEEAAFLWLLRDASADRPDFLTIDLAELDGRVEAHLDGLREAGEPGQAIVREQLEANQEPGEVFTAVVSAIESGESIHLRSVFKAVTSEELIRPAASAIGWVGEGAARVAIAAALADDRPAVRCAGVAGAAVRRLDIGRHLQSALNDPDPHLQARAAKAVGELGLVAFGGQLGRLLKSDDARVRADAAWSLALLRRDPTALKVLRATAIAEATNRRRPAETAARCLSVQDGHAWLRMLEGLPDCKRVTVQAAGALGDPALVPWLIQKMAVPELARAAGEALSMITGVHIEDAKLDREPPEDFEAGPNDNPDDDNVDMDPDEGLEWPDPDKVAAWWRDNKGRFAVGTRHLVGRPVSKGWCKEVLKAGYQRQRAAAAVELVLLEPGRPLVEVRAPGFRQ